MGEEREPGPRRARKALMSPVKASRRRWPEGALVPTRRDLPSLEKSSFVQSRLLGVLGRPWVREGGRAFLGWCRSKVAKGGLS